MPRTVKALALGTALLATAACDVEVEPGFQYDVSTKANRVEPAEQSFDASSLQDIWLPTAGWVLVPDATMAPTCGAVLIAPDVMMTASACLQGYEAPDLTVGFGVIGEGPEVEAADIVMLGADTRLAAIVLAEPITDLEPPSIATPPADDCQIRSIAYDYAPVEGEPGRRRMWLGCYDGEAGTVKPISGDPSCQGDPGAPAFSRDGSLVGITTAADPGEGCIRRPALAIPSTDDAFDEALSLSSR